MPAWLHPERVWKINAYLILAAGVLAVGLLAVQVLGLLWDVLGPSRMPSAGIDASQPAQAAPPEESLVYRLRSMQGGTVVLDMLSAQRVQGKFGYSSKEAASLRNQLFVDVEHGTQTRLLPQSAWLITRVYTVTAKDVRRQSQGDDNYKSHGARLQDDEDRPVAARVYEVATQDTDGDQRLTDADAKTLMLVRADGTSLTTLAEGVQDVGGLSATDKGSELRLVATLADGRSLLHRFNLSTWQPLPPISLPSLKEKKP